MSDENPDNKGPNQEPQPALLPYPVATDVTPQVQEPVPRPLEWLKANGLPIIGLLAGALLLCMVAHYSSTKVDWSTTNDLTGSIQDVVQIVAFIAGGWWAYFKFIKGRTFKESLIPVVSGRFASIDGSVYLVVSIQVKNVGLSKIEFNREGSALIVFEYISSSRVEIHTVADNKLGAFEVLDQNDRYIEPKEIIETQRLIALPNPLKIAYRLDVEVASTAGYTWHTARIVDKGSSSDTIIEDIVAP